VNETFELSSTTIGAALGSLNFVDTTGIELMRISTKQYPAIAYSILCNATELEFNICGCI